MHFSDMKILITDDEQEIRSTVKEIIMPFEATILEASNGEEALEIMKKDTISVAILDIMMPRMNGIELLRNIQQKYPETVCIMLTAYGAKEHIQQALQCHAFDFIEKPFRKDILFNRTKNALNLATNRTLISLAIEYFLMTNCKNVTPDAFAKMDLSQKNQILQKGVTLMKLKRAKMSFNSPI